MPPDIDKTALSTADKSVNRLLKACINLCEFAAERGAYRAIEKQRQYTDDPFQGRQTVRPRQVARAAKIADSDVYSALKSGSLKSDRGPNGEWNIDRDVAMAWIKSIKRC